MPTVRGHLCPRFTGKDAGEPHAGCVRSENIYAQTRHPDAQTSRV
jgi:hypothetical protein